MGLADVTKRITLEMRAKDVNLTKTTKKVNAQLQQQAQQNKSLNMSGQRLARQQKQISAVMNGGAQQLVNNAKRTNKVTSENDSFRKVLGMNFPLWKKTNQEGGKFNSIGGRVANRVRKMTHGMRGFRMEMLSVMFFGMGITKFVKGLITPSLQLVGVFDVFSAALSILFLPLAMKLLDWAVEFLDWVVNMAPSLQTMINWFAAIGYAVGAFLAIVGSVTLGLGGVIVVFGGIIATIASAVISVLGLLSSWKGIIAALLGISLASTAVSAFGGVLEKVTGFFGGLLDKIVGLDAVQGILERFGIAGETFGQVWDNILLKLTEKFKLIPEKIRYWLGIARVFAITQFNRIKLKADELMEKLTGKNGLGNSFKDLADTLNQINWGPVVTGLNTIIGLVDKFIQLLAKIPGEYRPGINSGEYRSKAQREGTTLQHKLGLAGRQTGGYIPHTGLYRLHQGETVNQAGSTFSPNITINASSNVDIEMLKNQLSEGWNDDLARMSRR